MRIRLDRARRRLTVCVLLCALLIASRVFSQSPPSGRSTTIIDGREAAAGEVLVRFARALPGIERFQLEEQLDADQSEPVTSTIRRIRSRRFDVRTLVDFLRTHAAVSYAEPNYIWHAGANPNHTQFPS